MLAVDRGLISARHGDLTLVGFANTLETFDLARCSGALSLIGALLAQVGHVLAQFGYTVSRIGLALTRVRCPLPITDTALTRQQLRLAHLTLNLTGVEISGMSLRTSTSKTPFSIA